MEKKRSENLVIVESPAKAKTIKRFLGEGYEVTSSMGHICDLSKAGKGSMGIDIEHGFAPMYEVMADKKKVVKELKSLASKATVVWLASDEDREGEAIAWHLQKELAIDDDKARRIVFHEITKEAIRRAIENPRKVDQNLVNAQQARRVLDRLVGFELSPLLWRKVEGKLSAGRVQSVAVRLIVDKEREIEAFKSTPYYRIAGTFYPANSSARTMLRGSLKRDFPTREEAIAFLEKCNGGCTFKIETIEKKAGVKKPSPPFTTSTLQQEASRKLGFSVSQTMRIAQKLYEEGKITYMRTDSVNLSDLAISTIAQTITESYGANYSKIRHYQTHSKGAQEAHEAIRPTYVANREIEGEASEKKLYDLIWKRAVASQMADAQVERTIVTIGADGLSEKFICEGEVILFDGFLKVYRAESDDDEAEEGESQTLPLVEEGTILKAEEISASQRYTQLPSRYTEASLVKEMERLGIGRPSTYAPTISTITKREYVVKVNHPGESRTLEKIVLSAPGESAGEGGITTTDYTEKSGAKRGALIPGHIGRLVTEYLEENFQDIMDYNFTAKTEENLDEIANGKMEWNKLISDFYTPFHAKILEVGKEGGRVNSDVVLGVDPDGKTVYAKRGKFGPYVQRGENNDTERRIASLPPGKSLDTITLEEALKLFELPRKVGEYEGKEITAAIGKYGPYIKHDGKFISLRKDFTPYTITESEAIKLIEEKASGTSYNIIAEFKEDDIRIIEGKYGPYIKHGSDNYRIPKGKNAKEAKDLTIEECKEIIAKEGNKTRTKREKWIR